jgi:L-amino acid N-acyltransferase YncA
VRVRPPAPRDTRAVADIYNEGIEERQSTFETRSRTADDVAAGFALAVEAERRGFHKLLGRLFSANAASVRLLRRCCFSDVGVHRRHARLDGEWRDVVVVERLLGDAAHAP